MKCVRGLCYLWVFRLSRLRVSRSRLDANSVCSSSKPDFISAYSAGNQYLNQCEAENGHRRTISVRLDSYKPIKVVLHEYAYGLGTRVDRSSQVGHSFGQVLVCRVRMNGSKKRFGVKRFGRKQYRRLFSSAKVRVHPTRSCTMRLTGLHI